MEREKLLYVSPFMPMKSGISDYSQILVEVLSKRYEITLYTDNYNIDNFELINKFEIVKYKVNRINVNDYKYIIYNIGNNPWYHSYIYEMALKYPGLVILHDFVLYYLFVGYYQKKHKLFSSIYLKEGIQNFINLKSEIRSGKFDLLNARNLASKYPFNKELIISGNKIMVHSEYTYSKVKEIYEFANVRKINMIKQIQRKDTIVERKKLFKKYKVPEDAWIVSSFGYIANTKLNHVACEIIKKLSKRINKKICYLMVGEGDYVDSLIDNKIIIKTGYVDLDEFNYFIKYSDIVLNLRYPSMGETSAALIRILEMGKACIINDSGWFSEIPDECALKLSENNIKQSLENMLEILITDENKRKTIEFNAKSYIDKYYNEEVILNNITKFLEEE